MVKKLIIIFLILLNHSMLKAQEDVLWKFKTKGHIYSSPMVEGNMIYFGSGDANFYAVNKNTGQKIWQFHTGDAIHSSPYIGKSIICFASADGNLYGVDKINGALRWKFESQGEKKYDIWDYYLSSPKGDEETIYWASGDGNLYAIHNNDGKLKWKFKTEDIVHASPVLYNENILIGSFDGNFYSIQKESGSLEWKFKTIGDTYFPKGEIQKGALVENDIVYFGSRDYNLYALNAKTGKAQWNIRQPEGWIIATPIEYKGNIYFGTSDSHDFYSMDKVSGTVNWTIPLNMRVYGTAVAFNDIIFFGTFDGKVLGVDYQTGEIKWNFQTEKSKKNYGTIYNEKGEFKDGFELYGDNFKESEALILSLGSILSSPVIDEGIIYFGSTDGNLYAVKLK